MKNLLGEYIQRKREEKNMSLREFATMCNLSHTHIDSIEKGIDFRTGKTVRLTNETIQKLSKALDINPNILFSLSLDDVCEKFSFYYDYSDRENIKSNYFSVIKDTTLPLETRMRAVEYIFKAYYSRSVEANLFDVKHIDFEGYASMLLYQEHWKKELGKELYKKCVAVYGSCPGIEEGKTYYLLNGGYNLTHADKKKSNNNFELTDFEKNLVLSYRNHPEMQTAIDKMLDITDTDFEEEAELKGA